MANGFEAVMKRKESGGGVVGKLGSRRIFAPQFKLQVLESYRRDAECRGNQRATARKYGIHRRQIQKWLQAEQSLRAGLARRAAAPQPQAPPQPPQAPEPRLSFDGPVDLSVSRRRSRSRSPGPASPLSGGSALAEGASPSPSYRSSSCESCEAWDLSRQPPPPPRPVKLFRPYLLDEDERRPSAFEAVRPRGPAAPPEASAPVPPRFYALDFELRLCGASDAGAVFRSEFRVHKWLQESALQRAHTAG